MLRDMFHQDPRALLPSLPRRRQGVGRNAPCPCGSGKKYKHCCLLKTGADGTRGLCVMVYRPVADSR